VVAAALLLLPESPRWLVVNGQLDAALAVMRQLYSSGVLPAGTEANTAKVRVYAGSPTTSVCSLLVGPGCRSV